MIWHSGHRDSAAGSWQHWQNVASSHQQHQLCLPATLGPPYHTAVSKVPAEVCRLHEPLVGHMKTTGCQLDNHAVKKTQTGKNTMFQIAEVLFQVEKQLRHQSAEVYNTHYALNFQLPAQLPAGVNNGARPPELASPPAPVMKAAVQGGAESGSRGGGGNKATGSGPSPPLFCHCLQGPT